MAGGVMGLVFLFVGITVIAGAALLVSGRWREGLPETPPDAERPSAVPDDRPVGSLAASDLEQIRLEQAPRGYRMHDVDDLIERLSQELQARDDEISRLRGEGASPDAPA
jgi:DivIVA domain-containing protein